MPKQVAQTAKGRRTVDGAGVSLTRVLGVKNAYDFDPFVLLDAFDSTDPADYVKGFPLHPHRGIETITYLIEGVVEHRDTLGNRGRIGAGESQWMTAGSGILHEEMPQPSPRLRGLQLWLNLPAREKMAEPAYFSITPEQIPVVSDERATVRVLSGTYGGRRGVTPRHIQAALMDVTVHPGQRISLPTDPGHTVFCYTIEGEALLGGRRVSEKAAALLAGEGPLEAEAPRESSARFFFCSAAPLREPIAWGGPIVMNTQEELQLAFDELERGTFIKRGALAE